MRLLGLSILALAAAAALVYVLIQGLQPPADLLPPAPPGPEPELAPERPAPRPGLPEAAGGTDDPATARGGGIVIGTVRDAADGAALVGADVLLWSGRKQRKAVTDGRGTYRFEAVPTGRVRMRVRTGNRVDPRLRTANVTSDAETVVDFDLVRGAVVTGVVSEKETSRPVAGATIAVQGATAKNAESGPDGTYRIEGLGAGLSLLTVSSANHPAVRVPVSVEEGQDEVRLDISVARGAVVGGVVVDRSGRFVEGARVTFQGLAPATKVVTDGSGRFELRAVPVDRTVWIIADGDGYVSARSEPLRLRGGESLTDLTLTLTVGGAVRGVVLDHGGNPVAGAAVRVVPRPPFRWRGGRLPNAKTREDGSFELRPVPAGNYRAVAHHPGALEARVDLPDLEEGGLLEGVELRLGAAEEIEGVVIDEAGNPLVGVNVLARPAVQKPGIRWANARTVAGGAFVLGGLAPGSYHVTARPRRGGQEASRQDVPAGTKDLVLRLPAPGVLAGKVVLPDGKPATAYSIRVVPEDAGNGARLFERVSSADGAFRISGVSPGRYVITASGTSGFSEALSGIVVTAGTETSGILMTLSAAAAVRGKVLDSGGRPVGGARVSVTGATPGVRTGGGSARADGDGAFRVTGLRPGTYRVTAMKDGLTARSEEVVLVSGEEIETVLRFPELGRLTIRIADEAGSPLEGVIVHLRTDAGDWIPVRPAPVSESLPPAERAEAQRNAQRRAAGTDGSGICVREGVPAGEVVVRGILQGYADGSVTATVGAGRSTDVRLTLRPGTSSRVDRKERIR